MARAEKRYLQDRESLAWQMWLEEKAPTPGERLQQALEDADALLADVNNFNTIRAGSVTSEHVIVPSAYVAVDPGNPTFFAIAEGEMDAVALGKQGIPAISTYLQDGVDPWDTHPVTLAARRELEVLRVVDVEPEWDVATMVDAHRNGCTALDSERYVPVYAGPIASPLFKEAALEAKFDPRYEAGPQEREYLRQAEEMRKKGRYPDGRFLPKELR